MDIKFRFRKIKPFERLLHFSIKKRKMDLNNLYVFLRKIRKSF